MTAILPHNYGSDKFILQRCQGLFRPQGKKMWYNMLSMSKVTITPSVDWIDILAYDDSATKKVDSIVKQKGADISIVMDQKNQVSWHAQNLSNDIGRVNSQAPGTLLPISIPNSEIFFDALDPGIYQIRDAQGQPVQNISALVLKWGKDNADADVTLTAGVHYNFNALTGTFWLIARPNTVAEGDETALTGTYTKAAVDVSKRLIDVGGLSGEGLKGALTLLGVNTGFLWRLDINLCRLSADGDNDQQQTDSLATAPLKGPILAVDHNDDGIAIPEEYQFYRLQQLMNPAS